ncbi:MAG: hypothetical protein JWN78_693, partial [Bacteroidota bacterium]|nr:hypothetical protein [Bacteroidota bacterium]
MKLTLLIMIFLALAGSSLARKHKEISPVIGTWKYTNQSAYNELQKMMSLMPELLYKNEYFIFARDNKFRHEFTDKDGNLLRTLAGKWKIVADKIKIDYTEIKYSVTVNYFFLENDLVLGQNFNHVIFTRGEPNFENIALK